MTVTPDKLGVRRTLRRVALAYRLRWRLLVGAAALVFVPLGALDAVDNVIEGLDLEEADLSVVAAVLAALAATVLVATLGDQFYAGIVGEAARELRSDRSVALLRVLRSLPYWRLIAVDVLYTGAVALGVLLLLVPGVLAFAWLALAAPLVTIENLGVRASLRRSASLVRGSTGRVLAILVAVVLGSELLSEVVEEAAGTLLGGGFVAVWIGSAASSTLLAPFPALAVVVLAYELLELRDPHAARAARTGGGSGSLTR